PRVYKRAIRPLLWTTPARPGVVLPRSLRTAVLGGRVPGEGGCGRRAVRRFPGRLSRGLSVTLRIAVVRLSVRLPVRLLAGGTGGEGSAFPGGTPRGALRHDQRRVTAQTLAQLPRGRLHQLVPIGVVDVRLPGHGEELHPFRGDVPQPAHEFVQTTQTRQTGIGGERRGGRVQNGIQLRRIQQYVIAADLVDERPEEALLAFHPVGVTSVAERLAGPHITECLLPVQR